MNYEEATARCWAEIDLDALKANYLEAKRLVKPETKVVCVLKGNGYGLDARIACGALQRSGADYFAVASGDEAEELLTAYPGLDVLILGHVGSVQAARLVRLGAVFTVFSESEGLALAEAARCADRPLRCHIKVDTGLYRLGFTEAMQIRRTITGMQALTECAFEGYFTHLALHNRETDEKQFERFDLILNELKLAGITFPMVHMCDSIGMVRYPARQYNAVRTGAWLYGNCPTGYTHPEDCKLTVAIRARIAQIHEVPAGEMVGYDDDHILTRDSRIATLTAGYCDGIPRFNHVGQVAIRGVRCPVFGLACMDQMMVDVTDLPEAEPGDIVTFLGGGISLVEYASWTHMNRNEALARIGRRVTRVYTENGKISYSNDIQKEIFR